MDSGVRVSPGINAQIFESLKQEIRTSRIWKEREKYCSIIFDETSLPPGLKFDEKADAINGFVDLGNKTNKIADHALTFMIRGATDKWNQLIAFYFSEGPIKTNELKAILKEIVATVVDIGLIPVALICDEKESFQSVIESLFEDTRQEGNKSDGVIYLSDQDLSVIYDPFHLLMGIRNAFITNNILHDGNISKWQDIVDVYKLDRRSSRKLGFLSELRNRHIFPDEIDKKKMETSIPVLSNKVAAILNFTAAFGLANSGISATMLNTSATVDFFDKLLDSCIGANLKTSKLKKLRRAVTTYSKHHEFWKDAVKKLENMQFIKESQEVEVVPTLKNWLTTVKSLQRLWDFFKSKNITTMRPAYFNCTPIDRFFKDVKCQRLENSACYAFTKTFMSQLPDIFDSDLLSPPRWRERFYMLSPAYTVGWLLKKILGKIKCDKCQNCLTSELAYGSKREYKLFQGNELKHPSKHAVRYFNMIKRETFQYLDMKPHEDDISKKIKDGIVHKLPFYFLNCEKHKSFVTEYFISFTIRLCICSWCNMINKIMKGANVSSLSNVNTSTKSIMQKKALKQYKQILRNKKRALYLLLLFLLF